MQEDEYKTWLARVSDVTARCTVPLKNLFTDRMGYNLDNTPINIWIERSYRQDILLYVMGYIGDQLLFESGYYHKHSGCVSHLGEEHCIM